MMTLRTDGQRAGAITCRLLAIQACAIRGLSRGEVCEQLGISMSTLCQYAKKFDLSFRSATRVPRTRGLLLTADSVRQLLDYDPSTGDFKWRIYVNEKAKPGMIAGSLDVKGYLLIMIGGKRYRAHRLVWLHMHGHFPSAQIDHIDGNRTNNRRANLRDVSGHINAQNSIKQHNKFGLPGVRLSRGKKFVASVCVDGKNRYIGTFETPALASAAYINAKRALHPGFAG